MRSSRSFAFVAVLIGAVGHAVFSQQPVIPVHQIGAVLARSTDSIGTLTSIRPLSDGRVLVNDAAKRRLLLLDATLQQGRILADTTPATSQAYGKSSSPPSNIFGGSQAFGLGLSGMIRFRGDSTLIQDVATGAFIVIDPAGGFARLIPAPRAASNPPGFPGGSVLGFDQANHLLYRPTTTFATTQLPSNFIGDTSVVRLDSSLLRRVNIESWRPDTIARVQVPRVRDFTTRAAMSINTRSATSPIPSGDDATVLNDGVLAIVRVRDYHMEWIAPDGHRSSGPPIPTDWVPITTAAKVAILDSLRVRDSTADARTAAAAVARGDTPFLPVRSYVKPTDLPDNQPPFVSGSMMGDADGNVWIMVKGPGLQRLDAPQGAPAPLSIAGPVFDIINRRGERVDRVQLPTGATLAGFAPGVVYFGVPFRPAQPGKTVQLVAARIH